MPARSGLLPACPQVGRWPRRRGLYLPWMSKTLGKYRLLREVGRGAMATVYEALDPDLNRRVGLKVLREDSNPRTVERLHREAAAVAKLRHPNIVAVHEVGSVDGTHFIVMDYVAGKTLAEARGSLSQADRIRALATLAAAVGFAHRQGVVHRDLKPQNVLVEGTTGRLFLTDFGLAKVTDTTTLTRT